MGNLKSVLISAGATIVVMAIVFRVDALRAFVTNAKTA